MAIRDAYTKFDGFYVDRVNDRTIHVGWEDEVTIYIDVFDSARAATDAEHGDCIAAVLINVLTGEVTREDKAVVASKA